MFWELSTCSVQACLTDTVCVCVCAAAAAAAAAVPFWHDLHGLLGLANIEQSYTHTHTLWYKL